jgi:hypothetical protein
MKRLVLALAVGAGLLACGSAIAQEAPPRPRVGGAAAVDMTRADVVEARDFALAELEKQLGAAPEVKETTAQVQVVAGMNYTFHFELENGDKYDAVVFRSLQRELRLTSIRKIDPPPTEAAN